MQSLQFLNFDKLYIHQLPSESFDKLDRLPSCSAVYFVVKNEDRQNEPSYIGATDNLNKRWNESDHHVLSLFNHMAECDYLAWLEVDKEEVYLLESALIRHFKPSYNKVQPSGKRPLESKGREIKPYKYEFFHTGYKSYRVSDIEEINWYGYVAEAKDFVVKILLITGEVIGIEHPKSSWKEDLSLEKECLIHLAKCVNFPESKIVEMFLND